MTTVQHCLISNQRKVTVSGTTAGTSILMQRIVKKCPLDVDGRRPGGVGWCETLLADKDHR